MPIGFDPNLLESFFNAKIKPPQPGDHGVIGVIDYQGRILKYSMIICNESISISGDPEGPFRGDSFFEFCIPCDGITECGDGYYPDQSGLSFWYGDQTQKKNMTMMLLKRPDGDLKVWPNFVWSSGQCL